MVANKQNKTHTLLLQIQYYRTKFKLQIAFNKIFNIFNCLSRCV